MCSIPQDVGSPNIFLFLFTRKTPICWTVLGSITITLKKDAWVNYNYSAGGHRALTYWEPGKQGWSRLLMIKRMLLSHILGYHEHRQVHLAASPMKFPEKQISLHSWNSSSNYTHTTVSPLGYFFCNVFELLGMFGTLWNRFCEIFD